MLLKSKTKKRASESESATINMKNNTLGNMFHGELKTPSNHITGYNNEAFVTALNGYVALY